MLPCDSNLELFTSDCKSGVSQVKCSLPHQEWGGDILGVSSCTAAGTRVLVAETRGVQEEDKGLDCPG